jgi:hypothetical protein
MQISHVTRWSDAPAEPAQKLQGAIGVGNMSRIENDFVGQREQRI